MNKKVLETKKFYNSNAQTWGERHLNSFYHEKQFKYLLNLLPKNASVLDIGCANGVHVPMFLGIGRSTKYTGIDISSSFLKVAKSRYPQLTFVEGDISDILTLPKKKFDGFFAAAVLMHVPYELWETMFENIKKITKPGGIGYIVLPTQRPNPANVKDQRHFTLLDEKQQSDYLKEIGLKIHKKGTMDGSTKTGIWRWYIVQLP